MQVRVSTVCGQSLEFGSKIVAILGLVGGVLSVIIGGALFHSESAASVIPSGILSIVGGGLLLWGTL